MNIINQIEAAMSKLLAETGLECTCMTLHPEHHVQLINEFKDMVNVDPDLEEPVYFMGIPVYRAALPDDRDSSRQNPCLMEGFSIVGHYNFQEDYYVEEQLIPLVSQ
jgi:hypothetical protein